MPKANNRRRGVVKRRRPKRRSFRRPARRTSDRTIVRRNIHYYPARASSESKPETSWLDYLTGAAGAIAGKLITKVVTWVGDSPPGSDPPPTSRTYPVGTQQQIVLAADDFLVAHPLANVDSDSTTKGRVYTFPYQEVQLGNIAASIRPAAQLAHRGGQIAAAFVPLTLEMAENVRDILGSLNGTTATSAVDNWRTKGSAVIGGGKNAIYDRVALPSMTWDRIIAMPGAVVKRADQQLTVRCPSSQLLSKWHGLVTARTKAAVDNYKNCRGSLPLIQLCIAYQDYANNEADPTELYSAAEGQYEIVLTSSISMRSPGTTWLRCDTVVVQDSTKVATTLLGDFPSKQFDLPISLFSGSAIKQPVLRHLLSGASPSIEDLVTDFEML